MIVKRENKPTILYLHGFKSKPGDTVEQSLRSDINYNVKSIFLDHLNPEKTYRDLIIASKGIDLVVGPSMGHHLFRK